MLPEGSEFYNEQRGETLINTQHRGKTIHCQGSTFASAVPASGEIYNTLCFM